MSRVACVSACTLVALACSGPPRPAPSRDELRNATYAGITPAPVTLYEGRWLGEPSQPGAASRAMVELVEGFRLESDVDGDGTPEAVVLLAASEGGSGTFVHLALVGRRGRSVSSLATTRVGDRVQVRAGKFEADRIVLDTLETGPGDAACCPTEKARRTYQIEDGALREVESERLGPISLLDLVGPDWVLRGFDVDDPAPSEPEITLAFEPERVQGQAGCNRYFASIGAGGHRPTDLAFGPVGATRMACAEPAMALERRYLAALGAVDSFGFMPGRLALRWVAGDARGVLLFEERSGAAAL